MFRDNNKKRFHYQKNRILKKRTQSEEKVLLNRKTGIANALKYKNSIYLITKGDHKNKKKKKDIIPPLICPKYEFQLK